MLSGGRVFGTRIARGPSGRRTTFQGEFSMQRVMKLFFVFLFLIGGWGLARAESLPSYEGSIEGVARLESRSTFVPLGVCTVQKAACPKPERYWVLILEQSGWRVELEHVFARGQDRQPEWVDYRGVAIRPGNRLRVEGWIQPVSEGFAFLSRISGIRFQFDEESQAASPGLTEAE